MPDKPKVDLSKMDQATEILRQIMSLTNNYNELLKTFTPQERVVAGGIVFCIRSYWGDVRMVGVMVDREIGGNMIDTLLAFYRNPEQFQGLQQVKPIIQSANAESGKIN